MTTTTVEFTMPGKPYRVLTGAEVLEGFEPTIPKSLAGLLSKAEVVERGRATIVRFKATPKQAEALAAFCGDMILGLGLIKKGGHHVTNTATYLRTTITRINAALKDAALVDA